MCFVAFYRKGDTRWLLSNRDENVLRPVAKPPTLQHIREYYVLMPKDAKAGGTWVAVRNDGVAAVLLNGAVTPHISRPPYKHSRGLIIPEILAFDNPKEGIEKYSFSNIQPFSLVLSLPDSLFLYRWDGDNLKASSIDETEFPCWSSATLYNPEQILIRKRFWQNWITKQSNPGKTDFLAFANSIAPGNKDTYIKMHREGGLQTISSTVISISKSLGTMHYLSYSVGKVISHTLKLKLPDVKA